MILRNCIFRENSRAKRSTSADDEIRNTHILAVTPKNSRARPQRGMMFAKLLASRYSFACRIISLFAQQKFDRRPDTGLVLGFLFYRFNKLFRSRNPL